MARAISLLPNCTLKAHYKRHEMDLFGGDVDLWHLVLAPSGGGEALLSADYCRGDVSTRDLAQGHLVIRRVDDLDNLIRPGVGRQAMRRTRTACIAIGEQRLADTYEMLLATGIPGMAARITVTHPKFNPEESLDGGIVTMSMSLKNK